MVHEMFLLGVITFNTPDNFSLKFKFDFRQLLLMLAAVGFNGLLFKSCSWVYKKKWSQRVPYPQEYCPQSASAIMLSQINRKRLHDCKVHTNFFTMF